ncbi:hypothetical protein H4Q26_014670, partial [Puccinia striiformis f. sp. tritici PST-130]
MAPKKSKKRHKPPGSPTSSIASTPATPMNRSRKKKRNDAIVNIADSDEEPPAEDLDSTTPASTQTAKGQPLTDEQELTESLQLFDYLLLTESFSDPAADTKSIDR